MYSLFSQAIREITWKVSFMNNAHEDYPARSQQIIMWSRLWMNFNENVTARTQLGQTITNKRPDGLDL